ncbi:WLM-domain-containing protein [Macrolepiota fuliginosa MF-IS2]|uniref:WLM-domain-containing protein n=1 Tax=Macrolepiota fuliginosa MF-IS2 TaxID=1400762 RepID=A0A9P6C6T5_9AGAR|nr:WLM-domain-containing protein [Macrolepiota fuliginosa MF-IS2]
MLFFTVSHRGHAYSLELPASTTLTALHAQLEELTSVPPSMQKLLWKGKKAANDDTTLQQAGFKDGMKIQMLGSTPDEVSGIKAVEDERAKRDRIMHERTLKPQAKLRSTGSSSSSALQYRFHNVAPLLHLPEPDSAQAMLDKLANDPAILHVMQKHKFSVGLLTELAPHEQPGLLGLNENAGQKIKLRIRTNRYDGFRLYSEIRRVLCHELTHNVWGDHDENFKELNSKLNREVTEFERARATGTHYLTSSADPHGIYQPASELEAQAYVLGGSSQSTPVVGESREAMRRRVLEATMNRLRKEEEELELSCGTGKDVSTSNPDGPSTS